MNDQKPHWQAPVMLDPDTTQNTAPKQAPIQPAHTFAPELVSAETSASAAVKPEPKPTRKRRFGWIVGALLATITGSELYRFIHWGNSIDSTLGVAFGALSAAALGVTAWWGWQSFKGLRQLNATHALRCQAEELSTAKTHGQAAGLLKKLNQHYQQTPLKESLAETLPQIDSAYNDAEIIRFISGHAFQTQDEAARECIRRHSVQTGLMVAISPYASLDMWLVGWRNLRMLRELAAIYGIAPGAAAQWHLLKQVFHNIAFAGISEASIHASTHLLSTSLTASLSMRAGQGVGAGLFTARSGMQAMQLCRPLPLPKQAELRLSSIPEAIVTQLKKNDQAS